MAFLFSTVLLFMGCLIDLTLSRKVQIEPVTDEAVQYKYLIFTNQCYDTFFNKANWTDSDCLKLMATKLVGYGLVMGGAIVKLPQIIKIISKKSVMSISIISVILELSTNIISTSYCLYMGNPFSLYGENVFMGAQMFIIILLFGVFGKENKAVYYGAFLVMSGLAYHMLDPHHLPMFIIDHLILAITVIRSTSRLSQIIKVYRLQSTGSLSLITVLLTVLGNFTRIATIVIEASNDHKFLYSMICVTVLNSYILFQFFLYKNSKVKSD